MELFLNGSIGGLNEKKHKNSNCAPINLDNNWIDTITIHY